MKRREALRLLGLTALAPVACRFAEGDVSAESGPVAEPDVELLLSAEYDEVALLPGAPTRVSRFRATRVRGPEDTVAPPGEGYLGPALRLRRGQRVRIRFRNQLDEPSIVHWHGLDVPEASDGHPRLAVGPGLEYVYDFTVENRAGTYWYHPHPHQRTGVQVYAGLAGLLLVEDAEEEALGLPSDRADLSFVVQDRTFDAGNQLVYPEGAGMGMGGMGMGRGGMGMGRGGGAGGGMGGGMGGMAGMMALENGVLGERILVNGRLDVSEEVEAGWVRVRILNGSNARIHRFAWTGDRPMLMLGVDGGFLPAPISRPDVVLAPGQRADFLLDLRDLQEASEIALQSRAFPAAEVGGVGMGGMGMGGGTPSAPPQGTEMDILTLRIRGRNSETFTPPSVLPDPGPGWAMAEGAPVRQVPLTFQQMQWRIDGRTFEMEGVASTETVEAGSTQVWEFVNVPNPMGMAMAHPMHLHGRSFRVLSRSGGAPGTLRAGIVDDGWHDTVLVLPGEAVRIQIPFSEHRGLYLYHCHILEHEDLGMMRNFRIV